MRGPATLLWDIYENCPTPGWLDCSEPSSGCSVMWWWRTGGWESNLYKPQIFYPAVKLLSAITMITMITFLLVVSTTSSVLSYSDFTLDRYREQDQTIRHGKSKFINLQPLFPPRNVFIARRMFQLLIKEKNSHDWEGEECFASKNLKVEAISEQLRKSIRCSLKIINLWQENAGLFSAKIYIVQNCVCKNINSDISGGINGTGGAKNDRGGGKNVKLSLSGSHCDWRSWN